MADSIDLPAVGNVDKKWLYAGAALVAGIVGYAYFKSTGSTPAGGGGGTGAGGVTDPLETAGNVPGATGNSSGAWSEIDPALIDTVAEWTADVTMKLVAADWEAQFVYATLGKWLAHEPLTLAEKTLVLAAVAAGGMPPGGPYPITSALPNPDPTPNPTPDPDPEPAPTPTPAPAGPVVDHIPVTVARFTTVNPPWNSTMWGIGEFYGRKWEDIWNLPMNASLRNLRGRPENIRAGDIVYIEYIH